MIQREFYTQRKDDAKLYRTYFDATIKVTDVNSAEVAPITGTTNTFLLSGLGDSYTLTVSKTGFTTKDSGCCEQRRPDC